MQAQVSGFRSLRFGWGNNIDWHFPKRRGLKGYELKAKGLRVLSVVSGIVSPFFYTHVSIGGLFASLQSKCYSSNRGMCNTLHIPYTTQAGKLVFWALKLPEGVEISRSRASLGLQEGCTLDIFLGVFAV